MEKIEAYACRTKGEGAVILQIMPLYIFGKFGNSSTKLCEWKPFYLFGILERYSANLGVGLP